MILGIKSGQEAFHDDPTEYPVNTWTRIDAAGMVAKVMNRIPGTVEYLAVMMVLSVVPCVALWKASANEIACDETEKGASSLSALIVVLSMLVTIYHHSYDCLILSVVTVAMLLQASKIKTAMTRYAAIGTGVLMVVPMLNYVSTRSARDRLGFEQTDSLWQFVTMVNGICLALALLIAIWFALKGKTAFQPEAISD